ncbi:MAG: hypothetical protein QM755_24470 [Luteolibacter sp.]
MSEESPRQADIGRLPMGIRVALVVIRLFAWVLIVFTNLCALAPLVISFFAPLDENRPWWLLDAVVGIVLVLFLIGFSMRVFADGIEQAHRHRGGVTDAVRWLKFASTGALWMKWISVGLFVTSARVAVASIEGDSVTSLPVAVVLLVLHAGLLFGMIHLSRGLKRRFQEEIALRPFAE